IAVELEFFQFLVWKESRGREEGDAEHLAVCVEAEQAFLREHLGCWTELFTRAVEQAAGQGFYPALAKLLRAAVAWDAAGLGVTLRPLSALPSRPPEPEPMTCGAADFVPLESLRPGGEP
ncbi:MAG: molecular chaperone TorD family protein, partial [Terriglobales bacterium]